MCSRNSSVARTVLLKKIPKFLVEKPESLKWMWEQGVGVGNVERITVCPNETTFLSVIKDRARALSKLEAEYQQILGNPCVHPEYDRDLLFKVIMADTDSSRVQEEQLLAKWAVRSRVKKSALSDGTELNPRLVRLKIWKRSKAPGDRMFTRVDKLDYLRGEFLRLDKLASEIRLLYKEPNPSSNAFVTFEDAATAHMVCQLSTYPNPSKMVVSLAPESRSIYWENITMSKQKLRFRKYMKIVMIIMLMLLWVPPVIFVGTLLSPTTLSKIDGLQTIFTKYPLVRTIVLSTLPPMVLVLFFNLLPWILKQIVFYGGAQSFQTMDFSVMCKTWLFLVYNVIGVLCISGSLWDVVVKVLDDPRSLLQKFGDTLPGFGSFFTYYVFLLGVLFQPMKLLQLRPVLWHTLRKWIYSTPREYASLAAPVYIDWYSIYPYPMLVFTISMLYSTFSPIVVCVAIVYFSIGYLVLKYLLLYVYFRNYESCGMMWPKILVRMTVSVILFQVVITFFAITKTSGYWGLSMIPLLVSSFLFLFYYCINCESKYKFIPMYLWRHPPPNTSYPQPLSEQKDPSSALSTPTHVSDSRVFGNRHTNDNSAVNQTQNIRTNSNANANTDLGTNLDSSRVKASPALFRTPNQLFSRNDLNLLGVKGGEDDDSFLYVPTPKLQREGGTDEYFNDLMYNEKLVKTKARGSIKQSSLAEIAAISSVNFLRRFASSNSIKLKAKLSGVFTAPGLSSDNSKCSSVNDSSVEQLMFFGDHSEYTKGYDLSDLFGLKTSSSEKSDGKEEYKDAFNISKIKPPKSLKYETKLFSRSRPLRNQNYGQQKIQKFKKFLKSRRHEEMNKTTSKADDEISSPLILNHRTAKRLSADQVRQIEEMVLFEEGFMSSQSMDELNRDSNLVGTAKIMRANSELSLLVRKRIAKVKNRFKFNHTNTNSHSCGSKSRDKGNNKSLGKYRDKNTNTNKKRLGKDATLVISQRNQRNPGFYNCGTNAPFFLARSSNGSMVSSMYSESVKNSMDSVLIRLPSLGKLSSLNIYPSSEFSDYSDYSKYRALNRYNNCGNISFPATENQTVGYLRSQGNSSTSGDPASSPTIPGNVSSQANVFDRHRNLVMNGRSESEIKSPNLVYYTNSSGVLNKEYLHTLKTMDVVKYSGYGGYDEKTDIFGYHNAYCNDLRYGNNNVAAMCLYELNREYTGTNEVPYYTNGQRANYSYKNFFNKSLETFSDFNSSTNSIMGEVTWQPSLLSGSASSTSTLPNNAKSLKTNFIKMVKKVFYNDFNPAAAILDGSMDMIFSNTAAQLVDYSLGAVAPLKYEINYNNLSLSLNSLVTKPVDSPKRKRNGIDLGTDLSYRLGLALKLDIYRQNYGYNKNDRVMSSKESLLQENNGNIKNYEFKKYFDTNINKNKTTEFVKRFQDVSRSNSTRSWKSEHSGYIGYNPSLTSFRRGLKHKHSFEYGAIYAFGHESDSEYTNEFSQRKRTRLYVDSSEKRSGTVFDTSQTKFGSNYSNIASTQGSPISQSLPFSRTFSDQGLQPQVETTLGVVNSNVDGGIDDPSYTATNSNPPKLTDFGKKYFAERSSSKKSGSATDANTRTTLSSIGTGAGAGADKTRNKNLKFHGYTSFEKRDITAQEYSAIAKTGSADHEHSTAQVSNYQRYAAEAQHELLSNNHSDYSEPPMQTVYGILDGSVNDYFHPGLNGKLPQLWLPVKYVNRRT